MPDPVIQNPRTTPTPETRENPLEFFTLSKAERNSFRPGQKIREPERERINRPERETQLIQHAVNTVDNWDKKLQNADLSDPQIRALKDTRDILTHALIANHVYANSNEREGLPATVQRLEGAALKVFLGNDASQNNFKNNSGYFGALYLDGSSNSFIYANRGSENLNDWNDNLQQAPGLISRQYDQAIKIAQSLKETLQGTYGDGIALKFNGHSLGGGLASAQAAATGLPAITFNAAGLNQKTIERRVPQIDGQAVAPIQAFYVNGEVLSGVQDNIKNALGPIGRHLSPEALGQRINLAPVNPNPLSHNTTPTELHRMGQVLVSIMDAIGTLPK